jgi:uncharacterized protein
MFFESKLFRLWLVVAMVTWVSLFITFNDLKFLADHWFYPAIMVLGAFVAGVTPEGGGVVAFPVLNIFIGIERTMARDFSLMIQSIGMTSASIFILTHSSSNLRAYKPMLWLIPISFVGFVLGMLILQTIPVVIIQALFLSLIATFAVIYYLSDHRGSEEFLKLTKRYDHTITVVILLLGGMCASLFGTGADIILYTLLVTRFGMKEKIATHMSIMMMAGISILGYAYRHFIDAGLTQYQVQTWLCAFPVVLFMAPLGAYVLKNLNKELMLKFICVLNIGQMLYFNLYKPSLDKFIWSAIFTVVLSIIFYTVMRRLVNRRKLEQSQPVENNIETPATNS